MNSGITMEHEVAKHPLERPSLRWVRRVAFLVAGGALVFLVKLLPIDRMVATLTTQVDRLGAWGPPAFGFAYLLASLLFVPGAALTMASGAVFGLWLGTAVVSVASTAAAACAFLIGRHLARDTVRRYAARRPNLEALDRAIAAGGWVVVALLRLSPLMPFSAGNYFLGLMPVRFWSYLLTSWLSMLPGTFLYVYLGHVGRASLAAASGGGGKTTAEWIMSAAGLAATLVVTIYVTRLARRAVGRHVAEPVEAADEKNARRPAERGKTVFIAVLALKLLGCATYAGRHPTMIAALFGPPSVEISEAYPDRPDGPTLDHALLDALLTKYVDSEGNVDYRGLATESKKLDEYVGVVAAAKLDPLGRNERLAALINAYNAFTLRLILDFLPIASIKDIPQAKRWQDRRWKLDGRVLSLEQIENEEIRPHFKEPRIHFALVCAARGCPPLRNEAYASGRLEAQLASQARYVHSHDRWFRFDADRRKLELTALYDWYGGDFNQIEGSVLAYAAKHSPALRKALRDGNAPRVSYLPYDWSLNDQKAKR